MPKLGIVISNYNGWQDTLACLESLGRQTFRDFEVVLLDDGSPQRFGPAAGTASAAVGGVSAPERESGLCGRKQPGNEACSGRWRRIRSAAEQ